MSRQPTIYKHFGISNMKQYSNEQIGGKDLEEIWRAKLTLIKKLKYLH